MSQEILPNIEIINLALYLKKSKTLVIGDIHIGYEELLHRHGLLIPKTHFSEIIKQFELIFKKVKPKKIVLIGDIKHEFGIISREEWNNTLKLIDFLGKKAELILIKGNHDTILGPIAEKRNIEIREFYKTNDIFLCHGNKLINNKCKTIIIGHEHPAISLTRGVRTEKFKCFLSGKYKNKNLIVIPSFNPMLEGSDVLREKLLSPYLNNIDNFKVYIVGDEVYYFGRIKDILKNQE